MTLEFYISIRVLNFLNITNNKLTQLFYLLSLSYPLQFELKLLQIFSVNLLSLAFLFKKILLRLGLFLQNLFAFLQDS